MYQPCDMMMRRKKRTSSAPVADHLYAVYGVDLSRYVWYCFHVRQLRQPFAIRAVLTRSSLLLCVLIASNGVVSGSGPSMMEGVTTDEIVKSRACLSSP
jgi:hypothetical protein